MILPRRLGLAAALLVGLSIATPSAVASGAPLGSGLTGKVTSPDGAPLGGALVSIVSARPRAGASLASPWCYPDCGRHTLTGADGEFVLDGVDPVWLYEVYVEASGFPPQTIELNPRNELPVAVRLFRSDDPACKVVGRLLHSGGAPIVGAVLKVEGFVLEGSQTGDCQIDRDVWSDDDGHFAVQASRPLSQVTVSVGDVGTIQRKRFHLHPGARDNILQLVEGASITGLVLHKARPVAGVAVMLSGFDRPGAPLAETHEATSDASGRYRFDGVLPGGDFRLFTRMGSPAGQDLASIPREVRAPDIRQTLEVGELNLHPGHRVHGRVFFSDAHRPDGVLAVLERSGGEDVQERPLDADGAFAFDGVPSESVVLWFRTAEANLVPGYRLSPQSYSLDYLMRAALCGRVDDDLQLAVLFEPGAAAAYVSSDYHRRRLAPNDTRHADQQRIESSPLRGVPNEMVSRLPARAQ